MKSTAARFFERFFLLLVFCIPVGLFWAGADLFLGHHSAPSFARSMLYRGYEPAYPTTAPVYQVLFSPDDDITSTLIGLIDGEQEKICAAQYILSHKLVAESLQAAYRRGVKIELIVDRFCVNSPVGKAQMLARSGLTVYEYQPKEKTKRFFKKESIMHHKFFVFKKTIDDKSLVCTGSFNCTVAASNDNQENMVFIEDASLVAAFSSQFERLKRRSKQLKI